jgi:hypothetical protein
MSKKKRIWTYSGEVAGWPELSVVVRLDDAGVFVSSAIVRPATGELVGRAFDLPPRLLVDGRPFEPRRFVGPVKVTLRGAASEIVAGERHYYTVCLEGQAL